jgi:hypothetical protein
MDNEGSNLYQSGVEMFTEEECNEASLDPRTQAILGASLKAHYNDLVCAPVHDKFMLLLSQLEAKERDHKERNHG